MRGATCAVGRMRGNHAAHLVAFSTAETMLHTVRQAAAAAHPSSSYLGLQELQRGLCPRQGLLCPGQPCQELCPGCAARCAPIPQSSSQRTAPSPAVEHPNKQHLGWGEVFLMLGACSMGLPPGLRAGRHAHAEPAAAVHGTRMPRCRTSYSGLRTQPSSAPLVGHGSRGTGGLRRVGALATHIPRTTGVLAPIHLSVPLPSLPLRPCAQGRLAPQRPDSVQQ